MKKTLLALAISTSLFTAQVYAEENTNAVNQSSQTVEIEDSVTGVSVDLNENGEVARLRSTGRAELNFGDQKDIRIAISKAKMRARADIAKFLNERITTEEVMDNMEKTISNTTNTSSEATRETLESTTEKMHNSAESILKGLITVKTDINKQEKYVEVEMGYSPKTQKFSDEMSRNINNNSTLNNDKSNNQNSTEELDSTNGSERKVKKIKNYDSF